MSSVITNNMKKIRKKCNYTRVEVAQILGVHRNTLLQYENGTRRVNIKVLKELSLLYKCKISELI